MRTLRDFLLAETLLVEEDKDFEMPEGFAKIDARGRLSQQAADVLGFTKLKKGRLMAKTKDGAKDIRKEMGPEAISNDDPIKFVKLFFKQLTNKKLKEFLAIGKEDMSEDRVVVDLLGQWKSIGGKNNWKSSLKVIKFWMMSIMQAYGINDPHTVVHIVQSQAEDKIMIIKKKK